MPITVLSSLEQALAYLDRYAENKADAPEVEFEDELSRVSIHIDGERYDSSVPAELARGLWEYQEAIYRAVALTFYGASDIRRLTSEQQQQFELVFKVKHGSTDLTAHLDKFLKILGDGFLTMDSKHKAYVLVAIAIVLGTGYTVPNIVESQSKIKQEEFKANAQISIEQEKTRQFEVFGRAINDGAAAAFKKASEEGARAIVNRSSDAKKVSIGRVNLDRTDIEEVNQRATKEKATAEIIQDDFKVHGTNSRDAGSTRYILAMSNGAEFPVVVNHEDVSSTDLEKIWAAARDRKATGLEVNITYHRGAVRSAQIIKVL